MSESDAYKLLNIVLNPDGSLTRLNQPPTLPAQPEPDPTRPLPALSKEVPLNPSRNTFLRLFRPAAPPQSAGGKIPLILYFHGGGFILLSATTGLFHQSCSRIAARLPALVASVEYRLAPEHRLPAAYDDAVDAILWAAAAADPWLTELADFSKVFLMGSSAGGNIIYHAALRAVDLDHRPVEIVGLIMHQAFFGGVRRTRSEIENGNDPLVPMHVSDLMWSLALPEGADRGHVYCDVSSTAGDQRIRRLPACLVSGYGGDPLVDRERDLAKMLEDHGVQVTRRFIDGGHHAIEFSDEEFADKFYEDLRKFVLSVTDGRTEQLPGKAANM